MILTINFMVLPESESLSSTGSFFFFFFSFLDFLSAFSSDFLDFFLSWWSVIESET